MRNRRQDKLLGRLCSQLVAACICLSVGVLDSHAQTLSETQQQQLRVYMFTELTKENFLKHTRVTRAGNLSACELEFQYVYRDIRARGGAPVVLTGSFSAVWTPGKVPGYSLKINAAEFLFKERKWSVSAPPFINITVNGVGFIRHKAVDFVCESGGRCAGFQDSSFGLNTTVLKADPFDATLSWSLVEGGMDSSVRLSEIGGKREFLQAAQGFQECNIEINENLVQAIKKLQK